MPTREARMNAYVTEIPGELPGGHRIVITGFSRSPAAIAQPWALLMDRFGSCAVPWLLASPTRAFFWLARFSSRSAWVWLCPADGRLAKSAPLRHLLIAHDHAGHAFVKVLTENKITDVRNSQTGPQSPADVVPVNPAGGILNNKGEASRHALEFRSFRSSGKSSSFNLIHGVGHG